MKDFIIIDDKKIKIKEGDNLLKVLLANDFKIPSLCYHSDLKTKSSCRLCVVKIKGQKDLRLSCSISVKSGMEIKTDSTQIQKLRKINLEILFSRHCKECYDCVWNEKCVLLDLAKEYNIKISSFNNKKKKYNSYIFESVLEYDSSKCIDCGNCIEVCDKQGIGFWKMKKKGKINKVFPSTNFKKDCVYCGQCILHCPAGAFESVGEFENIEKPFLEKNKKIIFQIAPSVKISIGEEFGFSPGQLKIANLISSLKQLGADYVFDTSTGADFTTIEEAKEFQERLNNNGIFPMITSCCPSWVKFIEFYYPELISNFTSVRSPHIILGGLIKTYWAQKNKIDPREIVVVSIMPCISKKYEINRAELKINDIKPVDYVLTVREIARLIKKKKIDFNKIIKGDFDLPFGNPSEAGIIYGKSGGVMISAIREFIDKNILFKNNNLGINEAKINLNEKEIKLAVVSGLGNAKEMIDSGNYKKYHYIEVMACLGGCIGGGGQPIPSNNKIKLKRKIGLSLVGKSKFKKASENNEVTTAYQEFLKLKEKNKLICHTKYSKKDKYIC